MSTDSSRSSRIGGSGTTISSTTASTAAGASMRVTRDVFIRPAISLPSQHPLLQPNQLGKPFRHGGEEARRDGLADLGRLEQCLRERLVLDDRHTVLPRLLPDGGGNQGPPPWQHGPRAH